MHLFSSFLKYTAPVAIWFITNVFSTYYSKKLLVLHNEENNGDVDVDVDVDVFEMRGDIWYSMLHLALWLTFTQLLVSGTIGALIVRIPCTNKTADEEALLEKKEVSQHSSLLTFLFEAREKKHPTYNKILLTAACNALGSLCVNIAYIHGSVSLVQIIKTLEPVTTYVLSVGLLKMQHSPSTLCAIALVVAGAAYTSWKDSTYNHMSVLVALTSNFMMPLRNVIIKSTEEGTNRPNERFLKHQQPTGFKMFSLISAIGSVWIGCIAVSFSLIMTIPHALSAGCDARTLTSMVLSSVFYFGYNGASFVVLNLTDPVTHAVLNVLKRFFNILCNIVLLHNDFTKDIAKGLLVSIFGMMLFTLSKQRSNTAIRVSSNRKVRVPLLKNLAAVGIGAVLLAIYFLRDGFEHISSRSPSNQVNTSQLIMTNHQVMVTPFNAYGPAVHNSCKKTIIIRRKAERLEWSDQPFREVEVDDITNMTALQNDDMLCIQVGATVGAVLLSSSSKSFRDEFILGSNAAENILHQLKTEMVKGGDDAMDFNVVNRKSIVMNSPYLPATPAEKARRSRDDNSGNHIWRFGATRMINPYTVKFEMPDTQNPVSALVLANANSLHLPMDGDFELMKRLINGLSNLVSKIDKPTILLGIGIQAKFSDMKETKSFKLHEHQVAFMDEIAKRSSGKSVSVRGEFTETACINAGVKNCISLGCPSLTISRTLNLGQVLETKWNNVASKLTTSEHKMKIGIALPALILGRDPQYKQLIDTLLSVCEKHDCYFIVQAPYDKPQLLKYAGDKVDKHKVLHFSEGIEDWFEFMRTLDVVISTRIHGGMAGISNDIPTIIIPTDYRILELVNAMVLPHISFDDAREKDFTSLAELMAATNKDFKRFEANRRNRLKEYKRMLESIDLEMDPALVDIILDEEVADGLSHH